MSYKDKIQFGWRNLNLEDWVTVCHESSKAGGWWDAPSSVVSLADGQTVSFEVVLELLTPTKIALIHSEVSETLEGFRKHVMDDHLPHRPMAEVELADAFIRICDLAGAHRFDLLGAVREKMVYNWQRADHKPEARAADGGKRF